MFDTIILLTEPVEQGPLSAALLRHNPRLAIQTATSLVDLDAIAPRLLRRARLIAFATDVIVPGRLLERLRYGAYNFHPGPPSYPGWAPSHFAVYDRATTFGVTAHVMQARVDSGPIVAVDLFEIPAATTAEALEVMAYRRQVQQFFSLAGRLAADALPLPALPVHWCGRKNTHRHCAELCEIPADITHEELERRMAAFGDGRLGITPTITVHGRRFSLVGPTSPPAGALATATLPAIAAAEAAAAPPA